MPNTLEYYMWGYQQHFRISCEVSAKNLFQSLWENCVPEIIIVGLLQEKTPVKHPVCIDPPPKESGLDIKLFDEIDIIAKQKRASDPASRVIHTHQDLHQTRQMAVTDKAQGSAIAQIIEAKKGNFRTFSSRSHRINGYNVYVILCLPKELFINVPQLVYTSDHYEPVSLTTSLVDGCVNELLNNVWRQMALNGDAACGASDIRTSAEMLSRAAQSLTSTAVYLSVGANNGFYSFYDNMCRLSLEKYENQSTSGTLCLANKSSQAVGFDLVLSNESPLSSLRKTRKLMQICGADSSVITDSEMIFGIGKLARGKIGRSNSAVYIKISSHGRWELWQGNNELMRVIYGNPSLPRSKITKSQFITAIQRELKLELSADAISRLWKSAEIAMQQRHGAMLVVSSEADNETKRLSSRSILIDSVMVDDHFIDTCGKIDGAIMVDTLGQCSAIGVILDGTADNIGDSGRGARYNSALTYQNNHKGRCIALVISEDGMADIIPNILPKIHRTEVDSRIARLSRMSQEKPLTEDHLQELYSIYNWLDNNNSYLTSDQCDIINEIISILYDEMKKSIVDRQMWLVLGQIRQGRHYRDDLLE